MLAIEANWNSHEALNTPNTCFTVYVDIGPDTRRSSIFAKDLVLIEYHSTYRRMIDKNWCIKAKESSRFDDLDK